MSSGRFTVLVLFAFIIFELAFGVIVTDSRFIPQITLILLIFSSLQFGSRFGFFLGLFLGFFFDLTSVEFVNFNTVIYSLIGMVCGYIKPFIFLESPIAQWILPGICILLIEIIQFLILSFQDSQIPIHYLFSFAGHSSLWATVIASPFVYKLYFHLLDRCEK